ncbi:MAG: CvpA family protein [Patescibacteria group bacterium]
MPLIDIFTLVILLCFFFIGFRLGLIRAVGALIGLIVGIFLATLYYNILANLTLILFLGNLKIAQIFCFIIILLLSSSLVGLVFHIINGIFKVIAIIPFLKTFNGLLGGIFSLIEGIFVLGIALYLFGNYFQSFLIGSSVAPILIKMTGILISFLPIGLK